jgi:hypothetical protein
MATLSGALLSMWTAGCILIAIFLTVIVLSCIICTIAPPDSGVSRTEAFSGLVASTLIAGLFYIHIWYLVAEPQEIPETPRTRDILLTVPEESSVNAQVTSGNNTVNLKNL